MTGGRLAGSESGTYHVRPDQLLSGTGRRRLSPVPETTPAGRALARPASGWFVQERAPAPDRESVPAPGAIPLGQKRSGVFRELATRVWA